MKKIRTVRGDVEPTEIGITLIHEHPYMLDFDVQKRELADFRNQGGNCVVDQTTVDLGRQPELISRLAHETGLHVVASTGYYREEGHPEDITQADTDTIASLMIGEIEVAVEGVEFKAGLIGEIGTSEFGTTPQEDKILRASARAHLATGVAISVHTMGGAEALHALDVLQSEGVDPQRVIIDHIDLDHVEHIQLIGDRGAYLGFDTVGKERYRADGLRLEVLCAILCSGYEDQVVLSHDISKPDYLKANGGHGYGHLLGTFIPRLRDRISDDVINKLLVGNPRRALAF